MRVLLVSDAASVHTQRWAESLRELGDEVFVASFRPAQIEGVEVYTLPTWGLGKPGYVLAVPALRRWAARLQPDVVHAHYLTSYGFVAASAGLSPLVVTAWGSDVLLSPKESALAAWLASVPLRRADAVTTVAQHMNPGVVALGAKADEVLVLPFGVDTQCFRPPAAPRPPVPPLRVISTRNFGPVYNVATVVEAVRLLHTSGTSVVLDLVGDGPLRASLQAQAQAAGLQEVTRFHGHVNHRLLAELLGSAHVYVSSAVSDGSSVSLNEAMACGCFPVATDIAANTRWLQHGHNGLLFKTADAAALAAAVAQAAADAPLREGAARLNRALIEQHANWQHTVWQMRALYQRLGLQRL
jgi:L-malate glycosyltransferase